MGQRRRAAGEATPATRTLAAAGVPFTLHPYDHDPTHPSYGLEAAEALGVDPQAVAKTLLVDTGDGLAVAVLPVTTSLDLKAFAREHGAKRVRLASRDIAERTTGYVVGGISPLGQRKTLPMLVDASLLEQPRVYVSGGRRGLDVAVSPADLLRVTGARSARIATARESGAGAGPRTGDNDADQ